MNYRIVKFLTGVAYLVAIGLLALGPSGALPFDWSIQFTLCVSSGIVLAVSLFRLPEYLGHLEDRMVLRMLYVPIVINYSVMIAALWISIVRNDLVTAYIAMGIGLGFGFIDYQAFSTRANYYIRAHRGLLPAGIWINPPASALEPGDIILVHGPMADRVRNAVGHAEIVVRGRNGKLHVLSSMIESGPAWHTARALLKSYQSGGFDYIVMRLHRPLTEEQNARSIEIVEDMIARNKVWTVAAKERTQRRIERLPIPKSWKEWLLKKYMPTGYDQFGKFWGGLREDRWTCIGSCLYLLRELGVPVGEYATGAFGICGEFNPLMPVRFIRDPAYRWLNELDEFDQSLAPAAMKS